MKKKGKWPWVYAVVIAVCVGVCGMVLAKSGALQSLFNPDLYVADKDTEENMPDFDADAFGLQQDGNESDEKDRPEETDFSEPDKPKPKQDADRYDRAAQNVSTNNKDVIPVGTDGKDPGKVPAGDSNEQEPSTPGGESGGSDEPGKEPGGDGEGQKDPDGEEPEDPSDDEDPPVPDDDEKEEWGLSGIRAAIKSGGSSLVFQTNNTVSEDVVRNGIEITAVYTSTKNNTREVVNVRDYEVSIPEDWKYPTRPTGEGETFDIKITYQVKNKTCSTTVPATVEKVNWKIDAIYVKVKPGGLQFYEGQKLTGAAIKEDLIVSIQKHSLDKKHLIVIEETSEYSVNFPTRASSAAADKTITITSKSNNKTAAAEYTVWANLLRVYDFEGRILEEKFTNEDYVDLTSSFQEMCRKLQEEGKYTSQDGYLKSMFVGWSDDNTQKTVDPSYNTVYTFPKGYHLIKLYALPLQPVEDGYLVKSTQKGQSLVGYTGTESVMKVPAGVTEVKMDSSFCTAGKQTVQEIQLPKTLSDIDFTALGSMYPEMSRFTVSQNNAAFSAADGVLYNKSKTAVLRVPSAAQSLSLDENVNGINKGALAGCKSLQEILLAGEKPLAMNCLSDIDFLQVRILVPDSADDLVYLRHASAYAGQLDKLYGIGSAVKIICTKKGAEQRYENVQNILYTKDKKELSYVPEAESGSFTPLTGTERIGTCAFRDAVNLTAVILPETVTECKDSCFKGAENLSAVILKGEGLSALGREIFSADCVGKLHIYLSVSASEAGGWEAYLDDLYGPGAHEKMLVVSDGEIVEDAYGCVYGKDKEGKLTLYHVPGELQRYTAPKGLIKIAQQAFEGCSELVYLEFPEVTEIDGEAFLDCAKLELAVFTSAQIQNAEENAFTGCKNLRGVLTYTENIVFDLSKETLKSDIDDLPAEAFVGTDYFVSGQLLYRNTSKGAELLLGTTDLEGEIRLQDHTAKIAESALEGCTKITAVCGAEDVAELGEYAFASCSALTDITLGESLEKMGEGAFAFCDSLTQMKLPDSLKEIPKYAFYKCNSLEEVALGKDVSRIQDMTFYLCTALKEIVFPSELKQIGQNAFRECSALQSIVLPKGMQSVGASAFYKCTGMTEAVIDGEGLVIGNYAFRECSSLLELTIQGSTAKMGSQVFYQCSSLRNLTITGDMNELGKYSFYGCTTLMTAYIYGNVKQIGGYSFYGCTEMDLYWMNTDAMAAVETIGEKAFYGCSTQSNTVTYYFTGLRTIGTAAFYGCTQLLSVSLPKNLTELGDAAFGSCTSMRYAMFDNAVSLLTIGEQAFYNCYQLEIADFRKAVNLQTIRANAFYGCTSLGQVFFNEKIAEIGDGCFYGDSKLNQVSAEGCFNLVSIGEFCFRNCSLLNKIDFSETGLTQVSYGAFYNCEALETVLLPSSVELLDAFAFGACEELRMFFVSSELPLKVDENAFFSDPAAEAPDSYLRVYVPYTEDHAAVNAYRADEGWKAALGGCQDTILLDLKATDDTDAEYVFYEGGYYAETADTLTLLQAPSGLKGSFQIYSKENKETVIGEHAFDGCRQLTMIGVSPNVQTLPEGCFKECTGLEALLINDNLDAQEIVKMGGDLFGGNASNENFRIFLRKNCLADYAADSAWSAYKITAPDDFYESSGGAVYSYAYERDENGNYITIGERLQAKYKTLEYVPRSYEGILDVAVNASYIAPHAAEGCQRLTMVNNSYAVKEIGERAFADCTSLQYADLTSTTTTKLEKVGKEAFAGCISLKGQNTSTATKAAAMLFPVSIKEMGSGVLKDCTSLTKVSYQSIVDEIPDEFCSGCENLSAFTPTATALQTIKRIGKHAFYNCKKITSASWTAMENLETIDAGAYENCAGLLLLTMPDTIKYLRDRAFWGCSRLEFVSCNRNQPFEMEGQVFDENVIKERVNIYVPAEAVETYRATWRESNPQMAEKTDGLTSSYRAVSNVLYAVSGNDSSYLTAVCVPKSLALSTFYHSDSNNLYTIGIGKEALKDCRYITKFTVTELIYQIDDSAFENCTALSVLYMNSSVLEEIGANAFRNCSMLKVIELPETLESLGDGTFAGCTSLTAVYAWSYMPAKIGDHVFGEQIPEDLKIYVSESTWDNYIKKWGSKLTEDYGEEALKHFAVYEDKEG